MNTHTPSRLNGTSLRAHAAGWPLAVFFASIIVPLATANTTVTVNTEAEVRDIPIGFAGVCNVGQLWSSLSPNYRADFQKAGLSFVRTSIYPIAPGGVTPSLPDSDRKIAQIINSGAEPLFTHTVVAPVNPAPIANYLLTEEGLPGGDVPGNIVFLVKRYAAAPYNLDHQIWEIGNEPDLTINCQLTAGQYTDLFNQIHAALVDAQIRDKVTLCGPVLSWDYGFDGGGTTRDAFMDYFLLNASELPASPTRTTNEYPTFDVVTRHIYAAVYPAFENLADTPENLLHADKELVHFNHSQVSAEHRGERSLQIKMDELNLPATIDTGVTEMNLATGKALNVDPTDHRHSMTHALWMLTSLHYALENPRSRINTAFQFDQKALPTPGDFSTLTSAELSSYTASRLGYYDSNGQRSFPYWTSYIFGRLLGDQVISSSVPSASPLLVTATKDDHYVSILFINRETTDITVDLNMSTNGLGSPTLHSLTNTARPNIALTGPAGNTLTIPAFSAQVVRYPRLNALPVYGTTQSAAPTVEKIHTTFTSAPAGMLTYQSDTNPPTIVSGDLNLIGKNGNGTRTAVVFNGQALAAPTDRVQVLFTFNVDLDDAPGEGFVFAAYSQNPGGVGDQGARLGYGGQPHSLWAVKIDTSPAQMSILGKTPADPQVHGYAYQNLPAGVLQNQTYCILVDYDGGLETIRARLFAGSAPGTGTEIIDLSNRLDVDTILPAGTVFGFTAANGIYSNRNKVDIHYMRITAVNQLNYREILLDSENPNDVDIIGDWPVSSAVTPLQGANYRHDGATEKGARSVRFKPDFPVDGYREVFIYWEAAANRASDVPVTINHALGTNTININQKVACPAGWYSLGIWPFKAGTESYVEISNANTTGYVIADAVKFGIPTASAH